MALPGLREGGPGAGGPDVLRAVLRRRAGRGPGTATPEVLPGGEEAGAVTILWVGLASGVLSLAVARGTIFEPLRARLGGKSGELVRCYFCLGAWISAGLTAWQGAPEGILWPVAWAASWGVGMLLASTIDRLVGDSAPEP